MRSDNDCAATARAALSRSPARRLGRCAHTYRMHVCAHTPQPHPQPPHPPTATHRHTEREREAAPTRTCLRTRAGLRACARTHSHARTRTHVGAHTCTHTHAHTRVRTHTHARACTHARSLYLSRARSRSLSHARAHMRAHTHAILHAAHRRGCARHNNCGVGGRRMPPPMPLAPARLAAMHARAHQNVPRRWRRSGQPTHCAATDNTHCRDACLWCGAAIAPQPRGGAGSGGGGVVCAS